MDDVLGNSDNNDFSIQKATVDRRWGFSFVFVYNTFIQANVDD